MPVKRKKRKTKTKRKYNKSKAKKQSLNWSIVGLVLILVSVLAFMRGLVNLIYNQPIHLTVKRSVGLSLTFVGVLLLQSNLYFEHELVNSGFLNSFWHVMSAEFGRAGVTESVGGGFIGALGYQIFYPLLGQIGISIAWTNWYKCLCRFAFANRCSHVL